MSNPSVRVKDSVIPLRFIPVFKNDDAQRAKAGMERNEMTAYYLQTRALIEPESFEQPIGKETYCNQTDKEKRIADQL